MCIPSTLPDIDFATTTLEGEELTCYVQTYSTQVMDEAWRMDCYNAETVSREGKTDFQQCAMRVLRDKLGDGFYLIKLPPIRPVGRHYGRRLGAWTFGHL